MPGRSLLKQGLPANPPQDVLCRLRWEGKNEQTIFDGCMHSLALQNNYIDFLLALEINNTDIFLTLLM